MYLEPHQTDSKHAFCAQMAQQTVRCHVRMSKASTLDDRAQSFNAAQFI
jgi:hypothetical protein